MKFLWLWFATLPLIKIWGEKKLEIKHIFFQQRQKEQPVVKVISQEKEQKKAHCYKKLSADDDKCDCWFLTYYTDKMVTGYVARNEMSGSKKHALVRRTKQLICGRCDCTTKWSEWYVRRYIFHQV
jgi:hypothetical protein